MTFIKNDIWFSIECENVSEIELKVNDGEWKKLDLVVGESKEQIDFEWCLKQILAYWLI